MSITLLPKNGIHELFGDTVALIAIIASGMVDTFKTDSISGLSLMTRGSSETGSLALVLSA